MFKNEIDLPYTSEKELEDAISRSQVSDDGHHEIIRRQLKIKLNHGQSIDDYYDIFHALAFPEDMEDDLYPIDLLPKDRIALIEELGIIKYLEGYLEEKGIKPSGHKLAVLFASLGIGKKSTLQPYIASIKGVDYTKRYNPTIGQTKKNLDKNMAKLKL